jgi:hypothetical protein
VLECFVVLVSAVDRVRGASGFIFYFTDFGVDLAADGVMQALVAFMFAMRSDDGILGANRLRLYLVGFFVDLLADRGLGELDANVPVYIGPALRRWN